MREPDHALAERVTARCRGIPESVPSARRVGSARVGVRDQARWKFDAERKIHLKASTARPQRSATGSSGEKNRQARRDCESLLASADLIAIVERDVAQSCSARR